MSEQLADLVDAATGDRIDSKSAAKAAAAKPAAPAPVRLRRDRDEFVIVGLGLALALGSALFPWYIFFHQEKFGFSGLTFSGTPAEVVAPEDLSPQPQRIGAPSATQQLASELDTLATGTLPPADEKPDAVGLSEQPFPADAPPFRLVYVANGRALIEDDGGLWVVRAGSTLPDSSKVKSLEQRDGNWVLVTSNGGVIPLSDKATASTE